MARGELRAAPSSVFAGGPAIMTARRTIRPPLPPPVPAVSAAQALAAEAAVRVQNSPALARLDSGTRTALLRDLATIQHALGAPRGPVAGSLDSRSWLRDRLGASGGRTGQDGDSQEAGEPANNDTPPATPNPKQAATETIARRAGALSDEIDFPAFVAGLVHGTFDAVVDSAIRQMESFAELVSAVAKNADDFTRDNVSSNQARDWLAQQYPMDLALELRDAETGQPRLRARSSGEDEEPASPQWLADFGFEGQELNDELIEQQLVPAARRRVGESRQQMLATMVLLGLNRIVVRDGSISARVRFRAAARDTAKVDYAVSDDPGGGNSWGTRGNSAYVAHDTKISTVGVNVQAESDLKAELFGEVKINFASETLPLDRFVDQARMTLLQRHARPVTNMLAPAAPPPAAVEPPAPPAFAPAPVALPPPAAPPAPSTPPANPPA